MPSHRYLHAVSPSRRSIHFSFVLLFRHQPPYRLTPPLSHSPAHAVDTPALWKKLLAELWKKPSVAAQMERASLKSSTDSDWVVAFTDKFAMDSLQRSHLFIQESLVKLAGHPMRLRLTLEAAKESRETVSAASASASVSVSVPSSRAREESTVEDPGVQKVLDVFKGRVRSSSPEGESR